MLIRVEIPVDAPAIDHLLRHVFSSDTEAILVQKLREDAQLVLGLVAVDDEGELIGYAAFSPITLAGEDRLWVGLAPLAVAANHQGKGIGKVLVQEALNMLNEFSYTAVLVLGDPNYYRPLGFVPAARYQLDCHWPETQEALQIYVLDMNTVENCGGKIEYAPPFELF